MGEDTGVKETVDLLSRMIYGGILAGADAWARLDVTMPQFKVMMLLAFHGSAPVSWLAARMGVSPPNVTGILDRLEGQKWVSRQADPQDRRVVRVVLAPDGERLLRGLHAAGDARLTGIVAGMPREEREALHQGLSSLLRDVPAEVLPPVRLSPAGGG